MDSRRGVFLRLGGSTRCYQLLTVKTCHDTKRSQLPWACLILCIYIYIYIYIYIKFVVSHKRKICIVFHISLGTLFPCSSIGYCICCSLATVFDLIDNNIYSVVFLLLGDFPASEFDMHIFFILYASKIQNETLRTLRTFLSQDYFCCVNLHNRKTLDK